MKSVQTGAHAVHCSVCDAVFFVDDATYERVRRALDFDPTDNPFVCERCEEEYAEDEHRV